MEFKKGFTLAEVLITLVIIGVIAAMTIPTLINKTNEQETVTAVKKAYSVISQAYQKIIAENGEIIPSTLGENATEGTKTLGEMFQKQLNVLKVCGQETGEDCWSTENEGLYKFFNGSDWYTWNNSVEYYKLRLNDGMSVGVKSYMTYSNVGSSESLKNAIGDVYFDINGDKGPNTLGKDTFAFWITKYGVIPIGTPDDTTLPFSSCYISGWGCTAWITTKGNMDYLRNPVSW